jgi:nitrate/TMAO reductase-like tetraheme cytochrome c subunit
MNSYFLLNWGPILFLFLLICPSSDLYAEPCPTFFLRTDTGEIIDPIHAKNDSQPYSMRKTCGACHDYNLISKGYHFNMDWNLTDDNFQKNSPEPWKISSGMSGGYCTVPFRQLAKKSNSDSDEIDLTPFDFIANGPRKREALDQPGCGGCHPGGGIMENDRSGMRYDTRLAENPSLSKNLDGDYYRARWDKSGVVEVDCLFCHFAEYSTKVRNIQLKRLNYKWATVAASGIGQVNGAVKDGKKPKVIYNKRFFNEDGRIALDIKRKPEAENCLLCHGFIDLAKRGTTWDDPENPDVHQLAGFTCIDCHFGTIEHNFAKGDTLKSHVRDDLDNTMRNCEDCHSQGFKGAPIPKHYSIRNNHLDKLACTACHIPELNRAAMGAMVMSTGPAVKYPQLNSSKIGSEFKWKPAYLMRKRKIDSREKIFPVNLVDSILFSNEDQDGKFYPLFEGEIAKAYAKAFGQAASPGNDRLYFQSYENIAKMLATLNDTLAGNNRFKKIKPFFHLGGKVYSLDHDGKLVVQEDTTWVGEKLCFSINHNVLPSQKALGAGGCTDCHSTESHLFNGAIVTQRFGVRAEPQGNGPTTTQQIASSGSPVTTSAGELLGFNSTTLKLNSFFQYHLTRILPFLFISLVLMAVFIKFRFIRMRADGEDDTQRLLAYLGRSKRSLFWKTLTRAVALLFLVGVAHLLLFIDTGMLSLFVSLYKKINIYAGGAAILIFMVAAAIYYMLLRYKPAMFEGRKNLIWATNLLALLMLVSGLIQLNKNHFSVTVNLVISSVHSAGALAFLAAILLHFSRFGQSRK